MRLALVTGGSRGLGAALCREYRSRGWRVVEFSRGGGLDSDAAGVAEAEHVAADFSDPAGANVALGEALARLAERDHEEVVAVANAGTLQPMGPLERLDPDAIRVSFDVSLVSQVLFARGFLAAFADHPCPKTFVAVSSGAATKGYAGWSLYCAAKAALDSFVRALALEQADRPHPVVPVSVNPGVMDTTMQEEIRAASRDVFPARDRFVGLHEAGELRSPARVAAAIADIVAGRPTPGARIDV